MGQRPSPDHFTRHAAIRAQQRGVRRRELPHLLECGSLERPLAGGAASLMLSRDDCAELLAGGCHPDVVAQLRRRAAVCGEDGTVLTILVPHGSRGRVYRHGHHDRRPVRGRDHAGRRIGLRGKR